MSELLRLYRAILRLHTQLPSGAQRFLGDQYVKAEFRDHVKKASDAQMKEFCKAWTGYREILIQQLADTSQPVGKDIDSSLHGELSPEQRVDVDRLRAELSKKGQV